MGRKRGQSGTLHQRLAVVDSLIRASWQANLPKERLAYLERERRALMKSVRRKLTRLAAGSGADEAPVEGVQRETA